MQPPAFPEEWPAGVPGRIDGVLGKALAQDPAARYESAGAMVAALAALQEYERTRIPPDLPSDAIVNEPVNATSEVATHNL